MSGFGSSSIFGGKKKNALGQPIGGADSGDTPIMLNMTALMDILSNLLFFLLASYAAANTEIKGAEDMQLPASTSEAQATMSILVRVTLEDIEVEGKPVVKLKNGKLAPSMFADDKVTPLYKALLVYAEHGKTGVKMDEDNTVLLVLADKRADFDLVSKVLKTAGQAGFPNFRFAVLKR